MKANVRATPDLTFQVDAETEEELFILEDINRLEAKEAKRKEKL